MIIGLVRVPAIVVGRVARVLAIDAVGPSRATAIVVAVARLDAVVHQSRDVAVALRDVTAIVVAVHRRRLGKPRILKKN